MEMPVKVGPIKVLSQIKNSYILCESETSLLLFDQHAAHERYIYEELKAAADNKTSQPLLAPVTIQVTSEQNILLSEFHKLYKNFGFMLEQQSPSTWLITQVPVSKKTLDYENIILATLEQTNKESFEQVLTSKKEDILHTMACKAAVKFNDHLSMSELQHLIDKVAYLPGIYTCPHGRPFRLELTFNDLNSYFKRI
jgi:DNA mismatch repair protein MutL